MGEGDGRERSELIFFLLGVEVGEQKHLKLINERSNSVSKLYNSLYKLRLAIAEYKYTQEIHLSSKHLYITHSKRLFQADLKNEAHTGHLSHENAYGNNNIPFYTFLSKLHT